MPTSSHTPAAPARARPARPEATRDRVSTGGTVSTDRTSRSTSSPDRTPGREDTPRTSPGGSGSSDEDEPAPVKRPTAAQTKLIYDISNSVAGQDRGDVYKAILRETRWLPRGVGPFYDVGNIFLDGFALVCRDGGIEELDLDARVERLSEELRERRKKEFLTLLAHMPTTESQIRFLATQGQGIMKKLSYVIGVTYRGARSVDVGRLKEYSIKRMPALEGVDQLTPESDKHLRGFNHPTTGRMLCPRILLDMFDKDRDDFSAKVQNGDIPIKADAYPTFLYDEHVKFTAEDIQHGLCRSKYFIGCLRAVLTGPASSAKETPGDNKRAKTVLKVSGITSIEGECLAYVTTLLRYALSSRDNGDMDDGAFIAKDFYNEILSLFENKNDPWVISTMKFIHHWLLGHPAEEETSVDAAQPCIAIPSMSELLKEQRAARLRNASGSGTAPEPREEREEREESVFPDPITQPEPEPARMRTASPKVLKKKRAAPEVEGEQPARKRGKRMVQKTILVEVEGSEDGDDSEAE